MTLKNEDLINYQWKGNPERIKMPLRIRAKIFMPFSALRGYEEALEKVKKEREEALKEKHSLPEEEDCTD